MLKQLTGSDLASNSKLMSNMSFDLFITLNIFILHLFTKNSLSTFFTSLFINNIYLSSRLKTIWVHRKQTNFNWTNGLETIVLKSKMNTLLLFKVWFSFYRFCIQSNLCVYSLKKNRSVGYDLDVCKEWHAFFNLWNWLKFALLCRFSETATGGVL